MISNERVAGLVSELTEIAKMINGLIRHRSAHQVKEVVATYNDPFSPTS